MRTSLSIALSLMVFTGCESAPDTLDWDGAFASQSGSCDEPLGPTDPSLHQGLTSPSASIFARVGDMAVIDGTSIALGGLTNVQFYEQDANGDYQLSTYVPGPSGFAFGRTLAMDNGLAVISADNYQLPGQTQLTGRLRSYRKDANNQWVLDTVKPYINAADIGLVTGSTSIGFGNTLKMQRDTMVVGIQRADAVGATPKAIFTFTDAAGWELDTVLPTAGIGPMALDGDYLAAATRSTGVIRIYKRTDGVWNATPVATIAKPANASSQYAGCNGCMAFDGDRLIFGDIYANDVNGGAYVFERQAGSEAFVQVQELSNNGLTGLVGWRLDASEDRVYLGSGSGGNVSIFEWSSATGQYAFVRSLTDAASTGFGRGVSVDGSRLLIGRGTAARNEGTNGDRAELYVGIDGVEGFCVDDVLELDCGVGAPYDWDADGEDDGCRGTTDTIDPSVTVPAGTQLGDNVTVSRGASLGTGNVLADGSFIGIGATLGDNNTLGESVVIGRLAVVGSGNDIGADATLGRLSIIGDNNVFSGDLGYAAELGSNLDIPNAVVGALATLGSATSAPGDIACPGPLVMARGSNIASSPGSTFTCTGSTVVGPNTIVESADFGSGVRVRKQAQLNATVTLGDDVRIGREATLEGGVTVDADGQVATGVRLCDTSSPFSGLVPRSFVDPSCP